MVVETRCHDCKQEILILTTIAGASWRFNRQFYDANLVPLRHAWGVRKVKGRFYAQLLDGAAAPAGRVLTRHFCEEYRARYQDIEGCANVLRPIEALSSR